MDALIGLASLAGFIFFLIATAISAVSKDPKFKKNLVGLIICLVLLVTTILWSTSKEAAENQNASTQAKAIAKSSSQTVKSVSEAEVNDAPLVDVNQLNTTEDSLASIDEPDLDDPQEPSTKAAEKANQKILNMVSAIKKGKHYPASATISQISDFIRVNNLKVTNDESGCNNFGSADCNITLYVTRKAYRSNRQSDNTFCGSPIFFKSNISDLVVWEANSGVANAIVTNNKEIGLYKIDSDNDRFCLADYK